MDKKDRDDYVKSVKEMGYEVLIAMVIGLALLLILPLVV